MLNLAVYRFCLAGYDGYCSVAGRMFFDFHDLEDSYHGFPSFLPGKGLREWWGRVLPSVQPPSFATLISCA